MFSIEFREYFTPLKLSNCEINSLKFKVSKSRGNFKIKSLKKYFSPGNIL